MEMSNDTLCDRFENLKKKKKYIQEQIFQCNGMTIPQKKNSERRI